MQAVAPAFPAPEPSITVAAQTRVEPFRFTASGGEYFRIWIVNLLLTIVTLGIYSAWAKVRRLRYFYGSTSLAGAAFEYHGQPLKILKGRLIAVAALVLYSGLTSIWPLTIFVLLPLLLLAAPFVIVRSRRFHMRMSSWRNLRFGFSGSYGGAAAAYLGWGFVAGITAYLLVPLWLFKKARYVVQETSYGRQRLSFTASPGSYFTFYFAAIGMGIVALGGSSLVLMAGGSLSQSLPPAAAMALLVAVQLGLIGAIFAIAAYYERSYVNTTFGGVWVGPHHVRSQVRVPRLLGLYVTNVLGVLFTLGLFYPWALVRRLRYQIESMSVEVVGSLDEFTAASAQGASAVGEEVGEFFDLDFGL